MNINIRNIFAKFNTQSEYLNHKYLAEGEENIIYKVDSTDGEYVLRVSKYPRNTDDSQFEYDFTHRLIKYGIPIPKQHLTVDSKPVYIDDMGKSFTLYDFVIGKQLKYFDDVHLLLVADLMKKIHIASRKIDLSSDRLTEVDFLSWLTDIDRNLLNNHKAAPIIGKQMYELYKFHTGVIQKELSGLQKFPLHNDIRHDNLLFHADKLVAVIDFDECHKHYIPMELGWMIKAICNSNTSGQLIKRIRLFVDEYNKDNVFSENDKEVMLSTTIAEFARSYLKDPENDKFTEGAIQNILEVAEKYVDIL